MTQITEEFDAAELIFFIQLVRIGRKMNIDMTQLQPKDLLPEVVRETPTEILIEMIAGYKESTARPVQAMIEIMVEELKTRGVLSDVS